MLFNANKQNQQSPLLRIKYAERVRYFFMATESRHSYPYPSERKNKRTKTDSQVENKLCTGLNIITDFQYGYRLLTSDGDVNKNRSLLRRWHVNLHDNVVFPGMASVCGLVLLLFVIIIPLQKFAIWLFGHGHVLRIDNDKLI